jgi:hypothetical protein
MYNERQMKLIMLVIKNIRCSATKKVSEPNLQERYIIKRWHFCTQSLLEELIIFP